MGKQRRSWSVEERLATVLAVLSERQRVAEAARERGVNENQVYRWKEGFLEAGRQGLNGAKSQTADQRLEAENNQLKPLLGAKALEIEILKNVWSAPIAQDEDSHGFRSFASLYPACQGSGGSPGLDGIRAPQSL